jgi:hypothetical protein
LIHIIYKYSLEYISKNPNDKKTIELESIIWGLDFNENFYANFNIKQLWVNNQDILNLILIKLWKKKYRFNKRWKTKIWILFKRR